MQNTSALYKEIVSQSNHWFETSLTIGISGGLTNEQTDAITFDETYLMALSTNHAVFNKSTPVVGGAISGEIDIQMLNPSIYIPKMARLAPSVRATNGVLYSEWLPKGVYYIDTRQTSHNSNGLDILTIHGYDSMLMFEQDYPSDNSHDYPLLDIDMVRFIASAINIGVDQRTVDRMNKGYTFPLPLGYSCREMLGIIAASYGGNFIISDENQLLLIKLGDLPPETNYLVDHVGDAIVFGSDRILV